MKLLFITANRLGDAVLTTGVLGALLDKNPGASVTVICGPHAAALFRAVPGIARVIALRKRAWNLHWFDAWLACQYTRWDLIVDMRDSLLSRLLPAAEHKTKRGGSTGKHKVIENGAVLGPENQNAPPPAPRLWLDAAAETKAARYTPPQSFLALGPTANWPPKQWPAENFAQLALKLIAPDGPLPGAPIMVLAGDNERTQITPLMRALPQGQAVEVVGGDLLMVAACLRHARLFIGNDSGLMHMAAAMGAPTLGLFGPGIESVYGPWGPQSAVVRTPESRAELLKRLPEPDARKPNLMETLSVDTVYAAAVQLLEKTRPFSDHPGFSNRP